MRRLFCVLAIMAVALPLSACWAFRGDPFETSLPSSNLGLRVTDGKLRIWTGTPCEGTTRVVVRFTAAERDAPELVLFTPSVPEAAGLVPGVSFEYLTLGGPYPGFSIKDALPSGFDWRTAQRFSFQVDGPPVARGLGTVDFAPIATEISEHSAEHPQDTFYFPRIGWLTPTEVAAKDGNEFLTVCTPDPAKRESEESVVGVRVTDGGLRFWTGAPCPVEDGVVLTFQPGQAETILRKNSSPGTDIERISLDKPEPNFTVIRALPHDFDWRTAQSALVRLFDAEQLRVHDRNLVWSKTTQLAIPIAESAQHPPDTYYFEGQGWLNPADVAARDGTSMQTICGK
ncbi:hypothetical protein [Mycolicibacterium houstonense]|uniref:hypothetical protein n=2 Tax=Mycolicibacterium houstonense TaxID=146021 RepID=UPI00082CDD1D|nr:hypothetical protein [Mycolicibacterium houstonense]